MKFLLGLLWVIVRTCIIVAITIAVCQIKYDGKKIGDQVAEKFLTKTNLSTLEKEGKKTKEKLEETFSDKLSDIKLNDIWKSDNKDEKKEEVEPHKDTEKQKTKHSKPKTHKDETTNDQQSLKEFMKTIKSDD